MNTGHLSFTGRTGCYAELPLDVLAGATTFTIEIKFATTSTTSRENSWNWGTIAGREIGGFRKDDWALCVNGGKLCFWCSPAKGTAVQQILTPTTIVNDGAIHKAAVVSSGGAVYLYCDGSLVASANNVDAKITDAQTILLAFNSNASSYLQMDLYEARFWNVAKAANEVWSPVNSGATGLQGWYLSTADGLKDFSGNGRHATLYGSPVYTMTALEAQLTFDVDVARKVVKTVSFNADVQRNVNRSVAFDVDVARKVVKTVSFNADVQRNVNRSVAFDLDVKRKVKKLGKLRAWLPFDNSVTEDICDNTWTTYGNPPIGKANAFTGNALQLDGSSYIKLSNVMLGGKDFYIDGWVFVDSASPDYARVLHIVNPDTGCAMVSVRKSSNDATKLDFWANSYSATNQDYGYTYTSSINSVGSLVHVKLIYRYSDKRLSLCINDVIAADWTTATQYSRRAFDIYIGALPNGNQGLIGSVDELRIYDGTWFAYNYGVTPTAADYDLLRLSVLGELDVSLDLDVQRVIKNPPLTWTYTNPGTADDLITTDGETFIAGDDISYVQTNTGTAFYQTTRAKCFDLPATPEIWIKFDVYFDGSNRWRAFNGAGNSAAYNAGVTAQTNGELSFVNLSAVQTGFAGVCKTNTLQTVLLHMVSGSSDGVVEAWVDGTHIYTYTGDVNHGEEFADIYLQCDGAGTLFSNVIISNARIGLNDGFQIFSLDVARRVANVITLNLDVARYVLKPVVVPFIGEHFNHFVPSFSVFAGVTHRIILPTNSKVFLRAKGTGILHVFSDTDPAGVLSSGSLFFHSDIYAELDYCNSVFVELATTVTPVQVMHALMFSLDNSTRIASYALDEAIEFATGGKFWRIAAVISQFIADLNAADSYSDFLQDKCDINLDNADTGAITGSDAGGSVTKTAHSVVPEFVPVNSWGVPASGSVTTVRGLSVRFPDDIDSLSGSAKFILAGLNSDWILQSLILIEQSFGISFNEADAFTHAIDVDFYSEDDGILAYVETDFDYDNNLSLLLCINLFYYADVDTNSEDGISPVAEGFLLDRTIAHEFVHAVMAATIHNFVDLPLWFKEGAAELVHGVDDERKEDIIELLTSRKDDLQAALNDEETSSGTDPYAAGYVFLRYLAKQGQHQSDIANLVIADLLISDGATDSDYNALTDNTRQVFAADIARTLVRSCELFLDVVIRDVIRVAFGIDVARAILAELILFPIDAPPVFNSSRLKAKAPLLKAAPDRSRNTPGLQSFEVNISEQQITEQVKVAGVIPFDIMQKVNGQYLDYHYDMRVEKVQQEGIIYRCDCCADIDLLLYTQLNYTIPPSTFRKVGADNATVEIQTYYPPASAHVQKIAAALGLQPVIQFDNFLSTVLMDEQGGVTYADLIRDVFGWSSRVPTMLINCFIREGKFFVIQRGHESHTVDISNAKCSLPVITKELVRTAWGSTPWSKTQTTEFQHSHWQEGVPDDVTLSGGSSDTQGGGDSDKKQVREVSTAFHGSDYQGYTTYTYDRKGLLVQTYTYVEKDINGISQETHTTVTHGYDDDNTMIYTETFVQSFGAEGDSSSKSIEEKGYTVLPGGEKFLAWEKSTTYQNNESISLSDNDLVDERVTVHSPSRLGQTHTVTIDTNGDIVGSAAGQNTGDDRVTPFARYNAAALGKSLFNGSSNISSGSSGSSSGETSTDTETWETTIHGLALYDSSFPIHNEDKLYQVTQALRQLNRKTQETLSLSVYEFPHLIDFNDRIIFNGNEYFLVNNTATTTPRIFNEQNLTLRRWY